MSKDSHEETSPSTAITDPPSFRVWVDPAKEGQQQACPTGGSDFTGEPGPMGGAFTDLLFKVGKDLVTVETTQLVKTADLVFQALFITAAGDVLRHPPAEEGVEVSDHDIHGSPVFALVRLRDTAKGSCFQGSQSTLEVHQSGVLVPFSRCAVKVPGRDFVHGVVRMGDGDFDVEDHDGSLAAAHAALRAEGLAWDLTDEEIAERVAMFPELTR